MSVGNGAIKYGLTNSTQPASEGFVSSATFDARADIAAVADRKQILIWKLGQVGYVLGCNFRLLLFAN